MTVTIFLGSLLLAMAIGVPIAYALLICGVALMWHLDLFCLLYTSDAADE